MDAKLARLADLAKDGGRSLNLTINVAPGANVNKADLDARAAEIVWQVRNAQLTDF